MSYIFLDESGDLGFDFSKKKTSKYFVVACVFVPDKKSTEKVVKKIFRNLSKKEIKRHSGTLHFFKESPEIRKKFLYELNKKDIYILSIYLEKSRVYTRLTDQKQVLYNYIINILLDRIFRLEVFRDISKITLVASRRETNRFFNKNFCDYLESQTKNNHTKDISVIIRTPHEEKCLQIADALAWSLFRKREHGDDSYIRIVQGKILEENPLFR